MSSIRKSVLTDNIFYIVDWFRMRNYIDQQSYSDNNDNKSLIPTISQLKVMKLLYYVQGVSLSFYNMRAFPNPILHWEYGPAISKIHDKYRGMTSLPYVHKSEKEYRNTYKNYKIVQSNSNLYRVVIGVNDAYGGMSAYGLMMQTHSEAPWLDTPASQEIKPSLIKKYFDKHIVE